MLGNFLPIERTSGPFLLVALSTKVSSVFRYVRTMMEVMLQECWPAGRSCGVVSRRYI